MSDDYPLNYCQPPMESACTSLLRLAAIGAVVGGSAAAGSNIRRVRNAQIEAGEPANLVILNGATIVDFMRNLPGRRTVFRAGREIAGVHGSAWAAESAGTP